MINIKILGKNKELFNCVCNSIEHYGDMLCKRRSISISTASETFNELSDNSIAVFAAISKGKYMEKTSLQYFLLKIAMQ